MENKVAFGVGIALALIAGVVTLVAGGPVFWIVLALVGGAAFSFCYAALHTDVLKWELRWWPKKASVCCLIVTFCFLPPSSWLSAQWRKENPIPTPSPLPSPTPKIEGPFTIKGVEVGETVVGQPTAVRVVLSNKSKSATRVGSAFTMATVDVVPPSDMMGRWGREEGIYLLALKGLREERRKGEAAFTYIPPETEYTSTIWSGVITKQALHDIRSGKMTFHWALIVTYFVGETELALTYCGLVEPETGLSKLCRRRNDKDLPISALGWELIQ